MFTGVFNNFENLKIYVRILNKEKIKLFIMILAYFIFLLIYIFCIIFGVVKAKNTEKIIIYLILVFLGLLYYFLGQLTFC
jgi:uncharacterized RDD family membrane protein YckC